MNRELAGRIHSTVTYEYVGYIPSEDAILCEMIAAAGLKIEDEIDITEGEDDRVARLFLALEYLDNAARLLS